MPITDLPDKDNLVSSALQQNDSEKETPKSSWRGPVLLRLSHTSTDQIKSPSPMEFSTDGLYFGPS